MIWLLVLLVVLLLIEPKNNKDSKWKVFDDEKDDDK